jgi:adenylate cyclase
MDHLAFRTVFLYIDPSVRPNSLDFKAIGGERMVEQHASEWQRMLLGKHPVARIEKKLHRLLPSNPRCKVCSVPFGGAGGKFFRLFGRKPWAKNPTMCNVCQAYAERHPGGAEVELTMLFADVRGSTTIAERISPTEFSILLNRFFRSATDVLIDHAAWIDKFVGDEIVAFFFPNAVIGQHHAIVGIEAGRKMLLETRQLGLPVGIGIHTGHAYVGTVGGERITDVTAIGDDVNIAARLASAAGAGTIVASEAACTAAGIADRYSPLVEMELKGKTSRVPVRIISG